MNSVSKKQTIQLGTSGANAIILPSLLAVRLFHPGEQKNFQRATQPGVHKYTLDRGFFWSKRYWFTEYAYKFLDQFAQPKPSNRRFILGGILRVLTLDTEYIPKVLIWTPKVLFDVSVHSMYIVLRDYMFMKKREMKIDVNNY